MSFTLLAGILAGLIPALSYIPFLRSIFAGEVKPHRISWLIWSMIYTVIALQQLSAGGGPVVYVTLVTTVISYIVFYLSLSRGIGVINRVNTAILVLVLVLIIAATTIATPLQAIILMLCISGSATVFTLIKTYSQPWSESLTFWSAHVLGGVFSLLTVIESASASLLVYPIYATVITIAMVSVMVTRRIHDRRAIVRA